VKNKNTYGHGHWLMFLNYNESRADSERNVCWHCSDLL